MLCVFFLFTGCNYLDMVPEKDIETIESLFEQRTKVESWWKGLYAELNVIFTDIQSNPAYMGADEFVTCQALYNSSLYSLDGLKVADGLQMSQNPYGSIWYKMYVIIRNCNIFLENVDRTYNIAALRRCRNDKVGAKVHMSAACQRGICLAVHSALDFNRAILTRFNRYYRLFHEGCGEGSVCLDFSNR